MLYFWYLILFIYLYIIGITPVLSSFQCLNAINEPFYELLSSIKSLACELDCNFANQGSSFLLNRSVLARRLLHLRLLLKSIFCPKFFKNISTISKNDHDKISFLKNAFLENTSQNEFKTNAYFSDLLYVIKKTNNDQGLTVKKVMMGLYLGYSEGYFYFFFRPNQILINANFSASMVLQPHIYQVITKILIMQANQRENVKMVHLMRIFNFNYTDLFCMFRRKARALWHRTLQKSLNYRIFQTIQPNHFAALLETELSRYFVLLASHSLHLGLLNLKAFYKNVFIPYSTPFHQTPHFFKKMFISSSGNKRYRVLCLKYNAFELCLDEIGNYNDQVAKIAVFTCTSEAATLKWNRWVREMDNQDEIKRHQACFILWTRLRKGELVSDKVKPGTVACFAFYFSPFSEQEAVDNSTGASMQDALDVLFNDDKSKILNRLIDGVRQINVLLERKACEQDVQIIAPQETIAYYQLLIDV